MLVLSRKRGERLMIGSEIVVEVVRIGPNAVRFGITAPKELNVIREELQSVPKIQTDATDVADLGRKRGEFLESDEVADVDLE